MPLRARSAKPLWLAAALQTQRALGGEQLEDVLSHLETLR